MVVYHDASVRGNMCRWTQRRKKSCVTVACLIGRSRNILSLIALKKSVVWQTQQQSKRMLFQQDR